MNARRYSTTVLAIAGAIVGTIVAVNLVVDPYNYFGLNRLGVYISAEREAKPRFFRQQDYNALLIGDSKPAMIPVSKLQGYRFFNAALGGATTTEMEQFIDRFAHGIELVLIGLDVCKHDPLGPVTDPFAPWRPSDIADKTVNLTTLEYSIRTIRDSIVGAPPHVTPDGSFVADRWFELYDIERPARMQVRIDDTSRGYENYVYPGPERMASLRRIRTILEERDIRCVIFIPPLHEEVARRLRASGGKEGCDLWKAEVNSIFPLVFDFSDSPWSAATNFFRLDPVHFKPQVGADLINREILPQLKNLQPTSSAKAEEAPVPIHEDPDT